MSDPLFISRITTGLRGRLQRAVPDDFPGTLVTTKSPDAARTGQRGPQINLFLYQVNPNATLRNLPPAEPGDPGSGPSLALDLSYLVTCYGTDEDGDTAAHALLGCAMLAIHADPALRQSELSPAVTRDAAVRDHFPLAIAPQSLSQLNQLWSVFQTAYRPSFALEVSSVILRRV